ncbi:MAG: GNAT family N-acetyltransferase [Thermonemataceae bacterium]
MIKLSSPTSTPTVQLKYLSKRDVPTFFKLLKENKERLKYWLPWVKYTQKLTDVRNYVEEAQHRFTQGRAVFMGIWVENQLVGNINLQPIDLQHKKAGIGYWLDRAHTGQGIMYQAAQQIIQYGFQILYLIRVEIACAAENERSRAVPQRLGFQQEGILRAFQIIDDAPVDVILYSLLYDEWKKQALTQNLTAEN